MLSDLDLAGELDDLGNPDLLLHTLGDIDMDNLDLFTAVLDEPLNRSQEVEVLNNQTFPVPDQANIAQSQQVSQQCFYCISCHNDTVRVGAV